MFLRNVYGSSLYERNDLSDSGAGLNQSILNHVFLPHDLPSSVDEDYLTKSDHRHEYKILECISKFFESLDVKKTLPIFTILKNCIQRWSDAQNSDNWNTNKLQSTIEKLESGDYLSVYFYKQNAAILIEIDENSPNQPLVSAWQVLLPTETITSSLESHMSCFPVPTFRLPDRSQLLSPVHCELLVEFLNHTIESAKSNKSSYTFNEPREVPVAHYVCHWWVTNFQNTKQENLSIKFKKKHRDQIRWKSANLPFRRSGLWMTIKVVFHTILIKRLKSIGTIVYKLLMTDFLTYVIHQRQSSVESRLSTDVLIHCLRKIGRRLNKIEGLLASIDSNNVHEWIENVMTDIKKKIEFISPKLDWQEKITQKEKEKFSKCQFDLYATEIYQHSCSKLKDHLNKQQQYSKLNKQSSSSYDVHHWYTSKVSHVDGEDQLPSLKSLTNNPSNDSFGAGLTRIEIWIQSNLESWMDRKSLSKHKDKRYEELQSFYEDYQRAALDHYCSNNKSTDPLGYSRFIIISLTIIRLIHQKLCAEKQFERLKSHVIRIPHLFELFEYLIIPTRDDMIRARELYDYFREYSQKPFPDLLTDIESKNAFGVYFADLSEEMNETLRKIEAQVEQDKNEK